MYDNTVTKTNWFLGKVKDARSEIHKTGNRYTTVFVARTRKRLGRTRIGRVRESHEWPPDDRRGGIFDVRRHTEKGQRTFRPTRRRARYWEDQSQETEEARSREERRHKIPRREISSQKTASWIVLENRDPGPQPKKRPMRRGSDRQGRPFRGRLHCDVVT